MTTANEQRDVLDGLKGLVWRLVNDYPNSAVCPVYEAETVFGTYLACGASRGYGGSEGKPSWHFSGKGEVINQNSDSIAKGKFLAESDYRARVRSLFE